MVKMKKHPTLGIMVRSDGLILLPGYYFGKGKKEYNKSNSSRMYKKRKDYYKTEEYKLKKKLYYQKRKEAKCD